MIDKILGKKQKRRKAPVKTGAKTVPAKQYNELIDYYTAEMESLRKEMGRLKEQNTLIMKTAMRQGEKNTELEQKTRKPLPEGQHPDGQS